MGMPFLKKKWRYSRWWHKNYNINSPSFYSSCV